MKILSFKKKKIKKNCLFSSLKTGGWVTEHSLLILFSSRGEKSPPKSSLFITYLCFITMPPWSKCNLHVVSHWIGWIFASWHLIIYIVVFGTNTPGCCNVYICAHMVATAGSTSFFPWLHFCLSKLCVVMAQTHLATAQTHFQSCHVCFGLSRITNQNVHALHGFKMCKDIIHLLQKKNRLDQGQALLLHCL